MEIAKQFIHKHWFVIGVGLIVLISFVFRFYDYGNRWGLAYDQAHDAIVAGYALDHFKLPLVGPFSSAGPFQTGGEWYWIIMVGTALVPGGILSPWILLTLLSLVFVLLMIQVGKELQGRKFGLLCGTVAALSTAQITQSVNLTNQTPLALVSLVAIWSSMRYIKAAKPAYIFLLGLCISLATSIHLQGASLIFLALVTIVVSKEYKMSIFVSFAIGLIIPLLPIFLFDLQNDFVNSKGFLYYLFFGQANISYEVLGRRWLTHIGVFIPGIFGFITAGIHKAGYAVLGFITIVGLWALVKKKITRQWYIIGISLIVMLAILRYVKTPLFDSYTVFLHPFVLFVTAWSIYWSYRMHKVILLIALLLLIAVALRSDIKAVTGHANRTYEEVMMWKHFLYSNYPKAKFSIYDKDLNTKDRSLPLVLALDEYRLLDDKGKRIGVMFATNSAELNKQPVIYGKLHQTQLVDLSSSSSAELEKELWFTVNPSYIYNSTQEWYKDKR